MRVLPQCMSLVLAVRSEGANRASSFRFTQSLGFLRQVTLVWPHGRISYTMG